MARGRTGEAGNTRGGRGGGGRGRGRPPGRLSKEEKKKKKNKRDKEDRAKKTCCAVWIAPDCTTLTIEWEEGMDANPMALVLQSNFQLEEYKAFCEMPVINDMFKVFDEEYRRKINEESLKGTAEQEQELKEELEKIGVISKKKKKKIDEDLKSKSISIWQEWFKEFFEEQGITEKFRAFVKVKEEQRRKFREELDKLEIVMEEEEANPVSPSNKANRLRLEKIEVMLWRLVDPSEPLENIEMNVTTMGTPLKQARGLRRNGEEDPDEDCRGKRPATWEATHDKEASTSSWAPPQVELRMPRSYDQDITRMVNMEGEPNSLASLGDAANSPQFQAANVRANNVEQEDDANDEEDYWMKILRLIT